MIAVKDIFNQAMAISDNISTDGVLVSESDIIDYKIKTPSLINLGLAEIAQDIEVFDDITYQYRKMNNLLIDDIGFETYENNGSDLTFEADGAKMYSFQVDMNCTVLIQEKIGQNYTTLEQLDIVTDEFVTYKGEITPSDPNSTIRLVFSGEYSFLLKNIALFDKKIPMDRLLDYDEYLRYTLPNDVLEIYQVITEDGETYKNISDYKIEGIKTLILPREFEGSIKVIYKKIIKVEKFEDELPINSVVATPLAYFLLGNLMIDENPVISGFAFGKYDEERFKIRQKTLAGNDIIQDVY